MNTRAYRGKEECFNELLANEIVRLSYQDQEQFEQIATLLNNEELTTESKRRQAAEETITYSLVREARFSDDNAVMRRL